MPFLRVIRDKRGYETTYLMHWYREGSRQRSRILYVFRSPGGVRVGRGPLDHDMLREIEREYPDIEFDWPVVLENQQVIETNPEPRPRKRRRGEDDRGRAEAPEKPARQEESQPPPQPRFTVPAALAGATPDEQIAFLADWYPKIRERVQERTPDAARRETLLALVERLNSSSWTDADQITAGLGDAAEALERLSRVFAKRRRRSRKGRKPEGASPPETPPPSGDESSPEDE